MDKLEEIRQRTEAGGPIRRIDMKYLLSEVDRLNALHKREIIVTGEYAQRVIDLTARAEAAEAERDAAIADWRGFCAKCSKRSKQYLSDGQMDAVCATCRANGKCNWEWRGPQAGEGGQDD